MKMGTELLKEQYNILLNDQKSKLERLKQKKQQMVQPTSTLLQLDENNELELDEKNLDFENDFFNKLNKLDKYASSSDDDDIKLSTNSTRSNNNSKKLVINRKINVKKQENIPTLFATNENDLKESLSVSEKLREFKDENGRLRKVLAEKDYEITYLKKKIEEEKTILGITPMNGDAAATKIVELAKKLRELTASYESEKTKTKQLNKNLQETEIQLKKFKEKANTSKEDTRKNNNEENDDEDDNDDEELDSSEKKISLSKQLKDLKDKLNQTTHKMMEYRSQTEILKQDLKKTQKALEKEVGENVDIKSILSGQGNWKGRSQQIRILQNKLNELKLQVGIMDARASQIMLEEDELDDLKEIPKSSHTVTSGFTVNTLSTVRTADPRYRYELKKIEREKKEQFEKLKRDYEALENDTNNLKEKFEASKSRNKVLANENKTLKEQVKTLLEKGKHDDELIEALMKKQNQMKEAVEVLSRQNEDLTRQIELQSKDSQIKTMQEKNTIDHLKSIVAEREEKVKQLEKELDGLRDGNGSNKEFFIHKTQSIESTPLSDLNQRPASSSNNFFLKPLSDETILSRNSIKNDNKSKLNRPPSVSNLNAKLIEQKKENLTSLKLENNELKTLNKTSEIERMRLMELVKTLQKRIEDLNEKSMENENKLNETRRKTVNLEKQLEKIKLQSTSSGKQHQQKSANSSSTMDQYKIEELETSLLIQKDENDALKAALKSTLEAKEEDLRLYVEMLEGSKRIFLDGLKQYKQISTNED